MVLNQRRGGHLQCRMNSGKSGVGGVRDIRDFRGELDLGAGTEEGYRISEELFTLQMDRDLDP